MSIKKRKKTMIFGSTRIRKITKNPVKSMVSWNTIISLNEGKSVECLNTSSASANAEYKYGVATEGALTVSA